MINSKVLPLKLSPQLKRADNSGILSFICYMDHTTEVVVGFYCIPSRQLPSKVTEALFLLLIPDLQRIMCILQLFYMWFVFIGPHLWCELLNSLNGVFL